MPSSRLVLLRRLCFFFFFKQKTEYDIYYGLVGSEMCIRDSTGYVRARRGCGGLLYAAHPAGGAGRAAAGLSQSAPVTPCLLYTSDAADERSSVDLGGRRILKKKKNQVINKRAPNDPYSIHTTQEQHVERVDDETAEKKK